MMNGSRVFKRIGIIVIKGCIKFYFVVFIVVINFILFIKGKSSLFCMIVFYDEAKRTFF